MTDDGLRPAPTSIAFHFTRALGAVVSAGALCVAPMMVVANGTNAYSPLSALVVVALVLALAAVFVREITFIVTPRERRQPLLLETDWDKSLHSLPAVIGWLIACVVLFGFAGIATIPTGEAALALACPTALVALWLGYGGEQRITFDPARRVFTRGGVFPERHDLGGIVGVAVHTTTIHYVYHREKRSWDKDRAYSYKVVLLRAAGPVVDAQIRIPFAESREAEARAQWLARELALPYFANPALPGPALAAFAARMRAF